MQEARGKTLSGDEGITDLADPQDQTGRRGPDRRLLWAMVAVVGWVIDQITKHLAVTRLDPGDPVPVLGPVLQLRLVFNDGAAFSLGGGGQLTGVFTAFSSLAGLAVIWFVIFRLRHRGWAVVLGLLAAGIFGNLTDRLVRDPGFPVGHVIDFLQLPYWPIFNVADICVTSAAIGIIWLAVVKDISPTGRRSDPPAAESAPVADEPTPVADEPTPVADEPTPVADEDAS